MRTAIQTTRLLLEPLTMGDLDPLSAHWGDPKVREYLMDGRVLPRETVQEMIATSDELFETEGAGLWAIRNAEGTFLGCVGFWYFHDPAELELVVSLSPNEWGKGMASEACRAVIDHAFGELDWAAVQASTDAPNQRSLRMIRALGMTLIGTRPGEFGTTEVFGIGPERWPKSAGSRSSGSG